MPQPPQTSQLCMSEFPQDDCLWRIEWIGGISYAIDDEPRIRIYLSKVLDNTDYQKALLNSSIVQSDQNNNATLVDTKIGFIQHLKLGSVWKNGLRQFNFRANHINFDLSITQTNLVCLDEAGEIKQNTDGKRQTILSNYQYRVVNKNARKDSWVVLIENHPEYKKIIIPASVIFQRCYVSSPKAATKIIFGQIDKLIDPDNSGFIDGEPSVFRANIFKDFANKEAPLLINLLTDPEGIKNLKKLRRNLVVKNNNHKESVNLNVNFPFSNPMKLYVLGRYIKYPENKNSQVEKKSFLVSEILTVHTDFQFDTFIVIRKNSGKKGEMKHEDLKGAFVNASSKATEDPDMLDLTMVNDDVLSSIPAVDIMDGGGIIPNKLKEIDQPKDFQQYEHKGFTNIHNQSVTETGVSTGPSRNISQGARELDAIQAPPAKLDDFFNLLELLKQHSACFETIAVSHSVQTTKGIINYFPSRIKGVRCWHFRENSDIPRSFVVAACVQNDVWYHLVDIEAKGKNALSMMLIKQHSGEKISENDFSILIRKVAKANGWSPLKTESYYDKNWTIVDIRHSRSGKLKSMAQKILKSIQQ